MEIYFYGNKSNATNNVKKFSILQLKSDLFVFQWPIPAFIHALYKGLSYSQHLFIIYLYFF